MRKLHLLSTLLSLVLLACGEDSSTVAPPPPPSLSKEDAQVVTNCRALRNALEDYAAAHNGSYGEWWLAIPHFYENPYSGEQEPSGLRSGKPGQIGLESYACSGNVYGYRITGYGRHKMLVTFESLANVPPDVLANHDATVANAMLVLDAARRYGLANDGLFSTDVNGDTNKDGKTLIGMLANGELLLNPYSSVKTEPQDGLGLAIPGAVGYNGADSGSGHIDSFTIEAYGCDGDVILTMVPYTQFGDIIWHGCQYLRTAVEQFAQASGHYPHNLDTETTPGGKTVLDLVSGMTGGVPYFVNPYNQAHYVPTLGIASGNFTIGYQPVETVGVVTDYVITGRGAFEEIVRLGPIPFL